MTKTTTKKTIKKETVKVPTKQQFTYNRDILAAQMTAFIESSFQEMDEDKVYEINAVVNSIIEGEASYIKSCERNPKKMTDYELSSILVARNMDVISELYRDEPEGEKSEDDDKFKKLMNNLKQAAFHAYMEVDFTDLVDMLNYRRAEFDNIGSEKESIEALYIKNTPGNFEVKELPEIKLWERYLVYATIFGIANKVQKTMKIKLDEMNIDTTNPTIHDYIYFNAISNNISSSMSDSVKTSLSAVAQAAASSASGSGSGGGFSGGGGFGGGGGGGHGF